MRVLLLGGTTEATDLARLLAKDEQRFEGILSLAGRTARPLAQPIATRSGGFGGVAGLIRYLHEARIDALIDATHPFAAQMSRHAIKAALATQTPFLAVERPAWRKQPGDIWIEAADVPAALRALGDTPRTVFSGLGSLALRDLEAAPHHRYIVRLIETPKRAPQLPSVTLICARGPFRTDDDVRLFQEHGIEVVLAKNAGGDATVSKIEAARALSLPVILVERPFIPARPTVASAAEALSWLHRHYEASIRRGV